MPVTEAHPSPDDAARPRPPHVPVEIDLVAHELRAGGVHHPISGDDTDATLHAYLDLVRKLRGDDGRIAVREADVTALATTLDVATDVVTTRLTELMPTEPHPHRRRFLVVGILALLALFGATSAVILLTRDEAPATVSTDSTTIVVTSSTAPTTTAATTTAVEPSPTTAPGGTGTGPGSGSGTRPATTTVAPDAPATTLPPVIIDPPPGGPPDRVTR